MLSKIRSAARGLFFPSWTIPIALLTLVLLSYGLRAVSLGFYWDDLPYLWYFHRFGPAGIIAAFTQDRPFLSFIYNSTLGLLGTSSQAWQIFALMARWLCSFGFWWVLSLAWPNQRNKTAWAAILFTVYPGFTQQWISIIYGQAFVLFASTFFSIGITLWCVNRRSTLPAWGKVIAGLLALALSAFSMFSTEYFFGLELLRPILIWVIFTNLPTPTQFWKRALSTLLWWLPFLFLMIAFIIWRGFFQIFPSASLSTLQGISQSPWNTLTNLITTILGDTIEATLAAWGQTLQLSGILETNLTSGLRLIGVVLVTGIFCGVYLSRLRPGENLTTDEKGERQRWEIQAIIVGSLCFLMAGWPFWITNLPMRMGFPQDRYSLQLAPGLCLLGAGLVDWLGGKPCKARSDLLRKAVMIAVVVGLSTGFHDKLSLQYRQDWNTMRDFFWQLTWRAPDVEPGTLFMTGNMPFDYYEDDSLSAMLNWTYDPDGQSKEMDYILYDLNINRSSLNDIGPNRPLDKDFRATEFHGTTSQSMVVYYAPPGCVHVLNPVYDSEQYQLPNVLLRALPVTNPQQWILTGVTPAAPPEEITGSESKHRWCYYFEKAELARQQQDWQAIYQLQGDSIKSGLRPEDPSEYLPFIEAYIRLWKFPDAYQLTQSTYAEAPYLQPALCAVWQRSEIAGIDVYDNYKDLLQTLFDCSIP